MLQSCISRPREVLCLLKAALPFPECDNVHMLTQGFECQSTRIQLLFRGTCSGAHAPGHMLPGTCSGPHVPGHMFRGTCSGAHVPGHMFRGTCSGAHVQGTCSGAHVQGHMFRAHAPGPQVWIYPLVSLPCSVLSSGNSILTGAQQCSKGSANLQLQLSSKLVQVSVIFISRQM